MRYTLPEGPDHHVGTFVKTTSPQTIEILALGGLDFAVLDAGHGPYGRPARGPAGRGGCS